MKISPQLQATLEARTPLLQAAVQQNKTVSPITWKYYQDSEQQLIDLMNNNPPAQDAPGTIEASWVLYFLNYHTSTALHDLLKLLGMPESQITPGDWTAWETIWEAQGVLMGDGSLVSTAYYAVMDWLWSTAFLDYVLIDLDMIHIYQPFGVNPAVQTITGQDTLVVALFGDWGTGNYTDGNLKDSPSQLIQQQIINAAPDISIHLGDVYYRGSSDEEQANLLNCWPAGKLANFTLNSNHEMYDGAHGLFKTALNTKQGSLFAAQNQTTYFKIEFGNWLIIGIDTAYYDTSTLYMEGALTDQNQLSFLKEAAQSGKKIVLLSHHTGLNITGTQQTGLYTQVMNVFGQTPPAYWYWGHIHNGIVYSSSSAAGASTNCRCLGNSAIPIGNSTWLQEEKGNTVSFYTNQPLSDPQLPQQQLRVLNGYALLTFTANDVQENWFYQDGTSAWSSGS